MLRDITRRNDHLYKSDTSLQKNDNRTGERHVVIRDENTLEIISGISIEIDLLPDVVDQLDDWFRNVISRCGFTREDNWNELASFKKDQGSSTNARNLFLKFFFRQALEMLVMMNNRQNVHELTFVLVQTLALNIKQSIRGRFDSTLLLDHFSQPNLLRY